jgi:hypothetical protein
MEIHSKYLIGSCELKVGENPYIETACYLNLDAQCLECQLPEESITSRLNKASLNQDYTLRKIAIITPSGIIRCSRAKPAFASKSSGGGLSVRDTPLSSLLAISKSPSTVSLIFNEPLVFDTSIDQKQSIFFPGFDTYGDCKKEGGDFIISGDKDYISILDNTEKNSDIALAVAIGAPVHKFAELENNKLTLYLNNYGSRIKPRPICYTGYPFRDIDLVKSGIVEVYYKALNYMANVKASDLEKLKHAVRIYLEGRSEPISYELKISAAMIFLEWFDKSKTMNSNQLVQRLGIHRDEADAICDIRNSNTHMRGEFGKIIKSSVTKIKKVQNSSIHDLDVGEDSGLFLNYIYTLLGNALLNEIGFSGKTQKYFPQKLSVKGVAS